MKRLLISLGIVLVGIVFSVNLSYAECPYTDQGPYITIYKNVPGKNKVLEKWECVLYVSSESLGGGFCFTNQVAPWNSSLPLMQGICISGDFKVVHPPY